MTEPPPANLDLTPSPLDYARPGAHPVLSPIRLPWPARRLLEACDHFGDGRILLMFVCLNAFISVLLWFALPTPYRYFFSIAALIPSAISWGVYELYDGMPSDYLRTLTTVWSIPRSDSVIPRGGPHQSLRRVVIDFLTA